MKQIICNKSIQSSRIIVLMLFIVLTFSLTGCQKFLDQKPEKSAVIPTTLDELQRLLDNNDIMNSSNSAGLAELLSDNYFIIPSFYQTQLNSQNLQNQAEASNYIWTSQALPFLPSWYDPYMGSIYYSNIVLEQLPLIKYSDDEKVKADNIKGAALFYRAFQFYQLAQLYCKPYSSDNLDDLGIVLRLTSNVSASSARSTVEETYNQIIGDIKMAMDLLPVSPLYKTRPSKAAAYAALARTYLSMRNYAEAGEYADKALATSNILLDYNTITPIGTSPIMVFNDEVIFHSYAINPIVLGRRNGKIDSTLYQSYASDDLRKSVFFAPAAPTYSFRGSYHAAGLTDRIFDGLTVDELYLIRAECFARADKKSEALTDLNTLMIKRWRNGLFTPFDAPDANSALEIILTERRKELVYRGLRWSDIRRLNLENREIELKRDISGAIYTLPANDLRSVLLIPTDEINRSGIQQNPR